MSSHTLCVRSEHPIAGFLARQIRPVWPEQEQRPGRTCTRAIPGARGVRVDAMGLTNCEPLDSTAWLDNPSGSPGFCAPTSSAESGPEHQSHGYA